MESARRSLLKLAPDYTVEFVWIMSKYKVCSKDTIENLLRKVIALRQGQTSTVDLQVAKVKTWQGDGQLSAEVIEPARLPHWLARQNLAVVGATVHALLKTYDELPEFDLVVIDEASQVRVPEAAVPISLAGRAGRLVLAGDHLQLPPIINGVYPEPLLTLLNTLVAQL